MKKPDPKDYDMINHPYVYEDALEEWEFYYHRGPRKIMGVFIILLVILICLIGKAFGQTKEEVYNYLVEIDCKHPKIVTAQSILETGHFTSYSCKNRRNLFGLRYDHKYLIFDDWRESCRAYMSKIQYKYKGGDYYHFLRTIGYATDPEYIIKLKTIRI